MPKSSFQLGAVGEYCQKSKNKVSFRTFLEPFFNLFGFWVIEIKVEIVQKALRLLKS